MKRLALALALIATPAAAQTTATTNCSEFGFGVRCTTRTEPTLPQQQGPLFNVDKARPSRDQQAKDELSRKVAQMIRAGDCNGAVRTALNGGDVQLADQAKRLCSK